MRDSGKGAAFPGPYPPGARRPWTVSGGRWSRGVSPPAALPTAHTAASPSPDARYRPHPPRNLIRPAALRRPELLAVPPQEGLRRLPLHREIHIVHVLHPAAVELRDHHAHHIPLHVQQRPAGIAGLHFGADLEARLGSLPMPPRALISPRVSFGSDDSRPASGKSVGHHPLPAPHRRRAPEGQRRVRDSPAPPAAARSSRASACPCTVAASQRPSEVRASTRAQPSMTWWLVSTRSGATTKPVPDDTRRACWFGLA
jgi:hypothetical protein